MHAPTTDTTAPSLLLVGPSKLTATADPGARNATVTLPALSANDTGVTRPAPTITCEGDFDTSPLALGAGAAAAAVPVGTTIVNCTAFDAANNPSKPVGFTVVVGCPDFYSPVTGACAGVAVA